MHALPDDRLGGDTMREVLRARAERPAEAAIRITHKEVSRSEECQGHGGCRGQDAEGWTEEMLAWTPAGPPSLDPFPSSPPHLSASVRSVCVRHTLFPDIHIPKHPAVSPPNPTSSSNSLVLIHSISGSQHYFSKHPYLALLPSPKPHP